MKTEKNILIAFLLNLAFSVFELFGGIFTGSVAIASDAVHDAGDAVSIGISYFLERRSKKAPDARHTYGYARYSVMGGLVTTAILLMGSLAVIYNAVIRMIHPVSINYDAMAVFAVVGVVVNLIGALVTRDGRSLNQRAVSLHMLEDVLGWIVVLVGAIVMKLTGFALIDPIMSIGVSVFIIINAVKNLKRIVDIFLEKAPDNIDVEEITQHIREIEGVIDVHHVHLWTMDGLHNLATLHVVAHAEPDKIKELVKNELIEHGIGHSTVEMETSAQQCESKECHNHMHIELGHSHHGHHCH